MRSKILFSCAVVALAFAGSVPTLAQQGGLGPGEQACDEPTTSVTIHGVKKGKAKYAYALPGEKPKIPGPTLEIAEGDCLHVTFENHADRRMSMHAHGVAYTVKSDGTPVNDSCVKPGETKEFVFRAPEASTRADGTVDPGSAGYWHYHDHCMGTPHGTTGVQKGLFGALIVRRAGDPLPDHQVVLVMQGFTFNLKRAPKTPTPVAAIGERVEFVVIGHGELHHTFHLHAHRWADNRTGIPSTAGDDVQIIDNKTVGPADSFGFQVVAGEHVGPGAWMYHCHVQSHSDLGMEGLFIVTEPDGSLPPGAHRSVSRWRSSHVH
ncbi:MAG TPA: multicopper oxidase domain-containing protein [Actinomycetota bacterium]|jgi:manganese oxidase|nr:multicopper oxidase domain-containing protein [Actinomycetota bacterium]